jgi:hypothetical protein
MHHASVVVLGLAVLLAGTRSRRGGVPMDDDRIGRGRRGARRLSPRHAAAQRARARECTTSRTRTGIIMSTGTHTRGRRPVGLATLAVSAASSLAVGVDRAVAAIAIGRVVFGLALVLAFGVGLATILVVVGFGTIKARSTMNRRLSRRCGDVGSVASAPPASACSAPCLWRGPSERCVRR